MRARGVCAATTTRAAFASRAAAHARKCPQVPRRTCAWREGGATAKERACAALSDTGAAPRLCIASRRLRCGCALAPNMRWEEGRVRMGGQPPAAGTGAKRALLRGRGGPSGRRSFSWHSLL